LWVQQFGTRGFEILSDIAVTPGGISYVAGTTTGALGFKIGGKTDSFLRKYDPNGVLHWTRQFGTPGLDQLADVALDSSNNVYVASVDTTTTLVIRKFNANGTLLRTIINTDPNIRDVTALGVDSV
jgi:hypothetical protein